MKCPYCKNHRDRVVDSRTVGSGSEIRRRRKCLSCGRRFTTYERIQESVLYVVKKDGRREPYNRLKVLEGIQRACEKRPISRSDIENIVNKVELDLYEHFDREVTSRNIGELVMRELKGIDNVAYVRFASVYRAFEDSWEFSKIAAELGGTTTGRSRSSARDASGDSPQAQGTSPYPPPAVRPKRGT
ncbi:MAG: transcriptional regulator NrdR [Planctomycetota bacterium]|nr:transcriptional regulator NrdR [Planctomycetota bacterium]